MLSRRGERETREARRAPFHEHDLADSSDRVARVARGDGPERKKTIFLLRGLHSRSTCFPRSPQSSVEIFDGFIFQRPARVGTASGTGPCPWSGLYFKLHRAETAPRPAETGARSLSFPQSSVRSPPLGCSAPRRAKTLTPSVPPSPMPPISLSTLPRSHAPAPVSMRWRQRQRVRRGASRSGWDTSRRRTTSCARSRTIQWSTRSWPPTATRRARRHPERPQQRQRPVAAHARGAR